MTPLVLTFLNAIITLKQVDDFQAGQMFWFFFQKC